MSETDRSPEHSARRAGWRIQPIWFAYLGIVGLLSSLHPSLAPLRFLVFFSLIYLALLLIGWFRRSRQAKAAPPPEPFPDLPLPGRAEQQGIGPFAARLLVSSLLTLVNPFQLIQMIRQAIGQGIAQRRWDQRNAEPADYRSSVRYTLPFQQGEWLVVKSGATPERSHSWEILAQRYAADLVIADHDGRRNLPNSGEHLADYFCYGAPIVAAADGVVVEVRDGVRDAPAPGSGWLDWLSRDLRGNVVVIRHAPDEYMFLAHLIPGRIAVRTGQTVQRGQLIGYCGNSGHSSEPHLHLHLQDHPDFFRGMGLPLTFDAVILGDVPPQALLLETGMRVRSAAEPLPGDR